MVMVEEVIRDNRQLAQRISREIFIDARAAAASKLIILVVVGKIKQTLDSDWLLPLLLLLL